VKFSIVTPTFNSEAYICETIDSVIKQRGDFSIEYIIRDNLSTDRTCSIVSEYIDQLTNGTITIHCRDVQVHLFSEHDEGMYDAIKQGFKGATGEVYAYINSDDIYLPGAFDIIHKSLVKFSNIKWIKGVTSYINENSTVFAAGRCNLYRDDLIAAGVYGPVLEFIQQDSVFWRADLWNATGGVDARMALAGDYFLWRSFAKVSPLYSLNSYVSCFRRHVNQKCENIDDYFQEISKYDLLEAPVFERVRKYLALVKLLHRFLHPLCYRLVLGNRPLHLVLLKDGLTPHIVCGPYFKLKGML